MPKYTFSNGVMQVAKPPAPTPSAPPITTAVPIASVCTPDDLMEATSLQAEHGVTMKIPQATVIALETYQNEEFLSKFKVPKIDGDKLIEDLGRLFSRYEVHIGLLQKLLMLCEYKINIILDDSGSMGNETDSTKGQASPFMLDYFRSRGFSLSASMTRFEEQEDRLHLMIDFLSAIPTLPIIISFMNRTNRIILLHEGKNPEDFARDAHLQIRAAFINPASGGTPTMKKLREAFTTSSGKTMHYLFTDGVPSDCSIKDLENYIVKRPNPGLNPLTFISCTNVDEEAEWMKSIEEKAPFLAELDDYNDEKEEVNHDQGPCFPYSKGLWLMCVLVGAINPEDLDAIDDSKPFTKFTMSNLLGRELTEQEYAQYWNSHPEAKKYNANYRRFLTENISAVKMYEAPASIFSKLRF